MPTKFTRTDDLSGAEFVETNLRGARFLGADLSGAQMRGVGADGLEVDSPWLLEDGPEAARLVVNGVNVLPFVDAELNRRFPGRELRLPTNPESLREAWAALERAWGDAQTRAAALPPGVVDASVGGEWSFSQTLRHLVMATDLWLGRAVLEREQPFHPLGLVDSATAEDGMDLSVFTNQTPTYEEVLAARAERVGMVRDYIAGATADDLAAARANPHAPEHPETTLTCLRVILGEEWEHLRYALRDLDALDAERGRAAD